MKHKSNMFWGGDDPKRQVPRVINARLLGPEGPVSDDKLHEAESYLLELHPVSIGAVRSLWQTLSPSTNSLNVVLYMEGESTEDSLDQIDLLAMHQSSRVRLGGDVPANCLVLDDEQFDLLISNSQIERLFVARVDGPVEAMDIIAMYDAMESGKSPLLADLRTVAVLDASEGSPLQMASRSLSPLANLVAEDLAQYLASILDIDSKSVARPTAFQIERLLCISGSLSIRHRETEILSTIVDVGIHTESRMHNGPANTSLIYDVPTNTWHDAA